MLSIALSSAEAFTVSPMHPPSVMTHLCCASNTIQIAMADDAEIAAAATAVKKVAAKFGKAQVRAVAPKTCRHAPHRAKPSLYLL